MSEQRITIHVDGHAGHRGNVLAHEFLNQVSYFLAALAHGERVYNGGGYRKTNFEIVDAAKTNPTQLSFNPYSAHLGYNPILAFDWTWDQISRIADGEPVDELVDASLAQRFADMVINNSDPHSGKVWITRNDKRVYLDDSFKRKSEAVASLKRVVSTLPKWKKGRSFGNVIGRLMLVDDVNGEHSFAIVPPIGPDKIVCTFHEAHRDKLREYLFKTVRISGTLEYRADNPFPVHVDLSEIEELIPSKERLLEMRGLFSGRERDDTSSGEAFNGL